MGVVALIPSVAMVLAPVLPYFPQVYAMKKNHSSEGFSPYVCLVLLVANILRICFWYGKRFGMELLFQSIFMTAAQVLMLYIWFTLRSPRIGIRDANQSFWNWNHFTTYLLYIGAFASFMGVITFLCSGYSIFVESIGFISLFIESFLGAPQAISNFKRKSTEGMSIGMIAGWFLGDGFKTVWFIMKGEPFQFLMCGIIQLSFDVVILLQVFLYSRR